jgi:hypothetical protein
MQNILTEISGNIKHLITYMNKLSLEQYMNASDHGYKMLKNNDSCKTAVSMA